MRLHRSVSDILAAAVADWLSPTSSSKSHARSSGVKTIHTFDSNCNRLRCCLYIAASRLPSPQPYLLPKAHNGPQNPLLERLWYASLPRKIHQIQILTTTNHYRPCSPLLATRHRNASVLQQRIPVGVPTFRCRGRKFRLLVDRR